MIIVLIILIFSFLLVFFDHYQYFHWGSFIFIFVLLNILFIAGSLSIVYGGKNVDNITPFFSGKIELQKITIDNRDVYLVATYDNNLAGYNINTENGLKFLTIKCKIEVIEDGKNYIIAHTKKRGGFWWTLFFSREIIDYYEVHIPKGSIMHKES